MAELSPPRRSLAARQHTSAPVSVPDDLADRIMLAIAVACVTFTPDQKAQILALREERGWSAGRIAVSLGVQLSAVEYQLLVTGAEKHGQPPETVPATPVRRRVSFRNGQPVIGFNQADDELLCKLEAEGASPGQIARRMSPPRRPHTIRVRQATLARRAARLEAGAQLAGEG
ncbi:hypothetical protein [Caulobacter sp. S45]|uniref:hypothetical protein n=1 Tax=Caulobacter sp. S45 TaxID=1641861 RepID=UPI0015760045|nr:hypothetical protein [Caulobacter sp. S45]